MEWRPVPNLPTNIYWVSENGDVMNIKTGHILKDKPDRSGYRTLTLWYNKNKHTFSIHRLVAMAFIPNPNNLPFVLHNDNNKLNCHYSNLRWGTASENVQQAHDDGIARNPDVRSWYEVYNPDTGDSELYFGARAVIEATNYKYSTDGMYNFIKKGNRISWDSPYKGYYIRKHECKRALQYLGPIGYNISKYKNKK